MRRRLARPSISLLAVLFFACATAWIFQGNGCNQGVHYSLVRALADGVPWIDDYRADACDASSRNGHLYSNKAPGLPLATVPVYALLEAFGAEPVDAGTAAWILGLFGSVLPTVLVLLLVRSMADRLVPGYGTAAAITLGVGTMALPFATLYFSHALSAALGFAAFYLLWREREEPRRPILVAAGGVAAGLAVVTEYTLVFLVPILGLYAIARRPVTTRGVAYVLGFLVGIAPLLAFNAWAFGSPFQVSYSSLTPRSELVTESSQAVGALSPVDPPGLFGFETPQGERLIDIIAGEKGLLSLTPVVALAALGAVLLFRGGRRAEALTAGAVAIVVVVAVSAFWGQGGGSPGPRYVFPMLPFLALLLAPAFRVLPATTASLAVVSGVVMAAATLTQPATVHPDPLSYWFRSIADHDVADTVLRYSGLGRSTEALAPAALLLLAASVLAAASTPRPRIRAVDLALAVAGVAAFGYGHDVIGTALFVVALGAAIVVVCARSERVRSLPGALRHGRAPSRS